MKAILTYHRLSPEFEPGIGNVHPCRFRSHLELLKGLGLRSVTVGDLLQADGDGVLAITFDDGYACVHQVALDAMSEHGFRGTVCIVVDGIGRKNHWDLGIWRNRFRHLTWSQLNDLTCLGFEIASHTMSHHDLTRLPLRRLRWELEASKKAIEDRIGRKVRGIAYPFGRTSQRVIEEALRVGYDYGLVSYPTSFNDKMRIGRFSIHSIDTAWSIRSILGFSKGLWLVSAKCRLVSWVSGGTGIVKRFNG